MNDTRKPSVFLGSSREGEDVARAFEKHLVAVAETTLWSAGVFGLSQNTLESLVNALDRFDFAVLVITADDLVISRDTTSWRGRDNVMFELGLFMGRLGRSRTFILCDPQKVTLPSDLAGVTVAAYDSARSDGNVQAAVSPAATEVRDSVRKLGMFEGRDARRLSDAATDVEQITEIVSRLVYLLARSRAVELDVISTQFVRAIPREHLKKIQRDLNELVHLHINNITYNAGPCDEFKSNFPRQSGGLCRCFVPKDCITRGN